MFQSSRIASGICLRQDSMASSPFSPSAISKSSPSRILRATLRMTLESSTTKHVFICAYSTLRGRARLNASPCASRFVAIVRSRRRRLGAQIEHPVDVEHDQKLTVEPVNAALQSRQLAVEIDWIGLALRLRQFEYLADRVHQQPERFALGFDADRHRRIAA